MANIKFSDFTAAAAIDQTDSFLVGFDNDGGGASPTNNKWTFPEVAAGLAAVTATPYSIYAGDGTIGSGRGVTLTDTLSFSGGTGIGIGAVPSYYFEVRAAKAGTALARIRQTNSTGDGLIVRVDSTSSTVKALSVQNNGANQILNVYGDSVVEIKGQAYTEIETSVAIDSINWNNSNVQEVTLVSGATTDFDATNFKAGATYILKLIQPAGGNALVGWEAAGAVVNWSGGTPPTLSTAAAAEDIVTLICTSAAGNGTYYANATLNFS